MMTIIKLLFNLKLNKTKDRFEYIMEIKIYNILINKIFHYNINDGNGRAIYSLYAIR